MLLKPNCNSEPKKAIFIHSIFCQMGFFGSAHTDVGISSFATDAAVLSCSST